MPKIVIEKSFEEMTPEEVALYVKQLESENATLKQTHQEEIDTLKSEHQKQLERVKSQNYNKFIKDTSIKSNTEVENELDFNEMVS